MTKKKELVFDKHHRRPRSRGGKNDARNISIVPVHQHRAYHTLFANLLPREVALILNNTWIDPDYYLVAIPRKKLKAK